MSDTTLEKIQTLPDITLEKFETLSDEDQTRVLREYIEIKIRQAKTRYWDAEGNEINELNGVTEARTRKTNDDDNEQGTGKICPRKKSCELEKHTTSV